MEYLVIFLRLLLLMTNRTIDPNNPLPLYYQVYADLCQRIESGEIKTGEAIPSLRKLVEEYGVSRITVVKALDKLVQDDLVERHHGRGTFVKEKPPVVELEIPKIIGYLPNGLLHPYNYSVQYGISEIISEKHYYLQILGLDDHARKNIEQVVKFIAGRVDILVVYPRTNNQDIELLHRLNDAGVPMIMVDRYYREIDNHYIGFNGEVAAYDLTRTLLDRGHERIAILPHFEVNVSSIRERIAGYRRAMNEAGYSDIDDLIWLDVYSKYRPSAGQKGNPAMTESLRKNLDTYQPTAIVGINHDVAERVLYDIMAINAERARVAVTHNGSHNYELDISYIRL